MLFFSHGNIDKENFKNTKRDNGSQKLISCLHCYSSNTPLPHLEPKLTVVISHPLK